MANDIISKIERIATKKNAPQTYYSEEKAYEVLNTLATDPRSITDLCNSRADFPSVSTLYYWRKCHPEFDELYQYMREMRADLLMDDAHTVADAIDTESQFGSARVSKAKLQCAIRENRARFYNPAEYGTTMSAKLSGQVGLSFKDLVEAANTNG